MSVMDYNAYLESLKTGNGQKGDKGDKGDAGIGWNVTPLLDLHLDTVTTVGLYSQASTGKVLAEKGYPAALVGTSGGSRLVLTVMQWGAGGAVVQEIRNIGTSVRPSLTYTRYIETGAGIISPWTVKVPQRVDNTAGRAIYTWDDTANREQLIYGDTGKRFITDLVNPIFNVTLAKIRRINNDVELQIQLNKATGAGSGTLTILENPLPTGFRNQHTIMTVSIGGGTPRVVNLAYMGTTLNIENMPESAATVFILLKYSTIDAWPTTLPGTPDGAVPSA